MSNPYNYNDLGKNLIPSFVCHADILGYTQLINEAVAAGREEAFLSKLRSALSTAYHRVRKHADSWGGQDFFSIKVFTDNIVIGYPVRDTLGFGEAELGSVFSVLSEFQVGLAMEGFLVRGGIAFGNHYMDDDIVFGDALIEAVSEDKGGGPPRISLAPSAVKMLTHHIGFYGEEKYSPQYSDVLDDSDGKIFLHYLDQAFIAFEEVGVILEVFEKHKETLVDGLKRYRGNPGVRSKYEWAARYHNFVCKDFVDKHPPLYHPDADEMLAAAHEQAQDLMNYIIDVESYAGVPKRISMK